MNDLSDTQARLSAIDPSKSFIIQAPAGSGKTELLAQRYLNLLGGAVKSPEEIIAITFTRKAASEMRERIITSLEFASENPEPEEDYKKTTWKLAQAVLKADQLNQWELLSNPNRLRILTIDALSAMLSAQIPLLSGFGAQAKIIDDADTLYQQAIFEVIDNPGPLQNTIDTLLLHFDNNAESLSRLLMTLISKRDQWLPHIIAHYQDPDRLKEILEQSLKNIADEILENVDDAITNALKQDILNLAVFAANELTATNPDHPLCACATLTEFPQALFENLEQWRGIAHLFISTSMQWRQKVDKRLGFPTTKKPQKQQMLELLTEFCEYDGLKQALIDIIHCPPTQYNQQQWQIIEALLQILPVITAQLNILFRKHEATDFVELTLGALRALGSDDNPTDLLMHLDYQIRHILLDEFQDTSVMQFNLVEKLVKEWQFDDGKSLFLVGDPMQSIYRFRNAEVGLFLRAQSQGIANIQLIPLTLKRNFRSSPAIVDWVNQSFAEIFPANADISAGAVPYSSCVAAKSNNEFSKICTYASTNTDTNAIVAIIETLQALEPDDSIAILVRSRTHLHEIIPALNLAQLNYQAIELETLNHRPEIIDVVTLTKALLHLADRTAWLALLRAPWCGLTLNDLHAISAIAEGRPLWSVLQNFDTIETLSADAKIRLARIVPMLAISIAEHGRLPLSQWIKGCWIGLDGPRCLQTQAEHQHIASYFELLESLQHNFNLTLLEKKLKTLYAKPNNKMDAKIQVMTIHKSKGLEFDHVILPELQRQTRSEPNHLLMWLENPNRSGGEDLVLAPIKASYEYEDPIHRYLKLLESQKLSHESARLFYVAVTRTKKSLHLMCTLDIDDETGEVLAPKQNTFAGLIWDQYQAEFLSNFIADLSTTATDQTQATQLKRLPSSWSSSLKVLDTQHLKQANDKNQPEKISPSVKQAATVGTIIHEALQNVTTDANTSWQQQSQHWQRRLKQLGVDCKDLTKNVVTAIENIHQDKRGQWILEQHKNAESEYAITAEIDGKFQRYIIDRTFIDNNNTRWIIDYKTAIPADESMDDFLQRQMKSHQQQLNRYAKIMASLEQYPIKLGLYFPLCQGWIEWEFAAQSSITC